VWPDRFRKPKGIPNTEPEHSIFIPRATRYPLAVPISFVTDEERYEGHSVNLSESGLLASFSSAPELWVDGKIEMEAGNHYLDIHARVARLEGNGVGLAFCLNTDSDRAAVAVLILVISPDTSTDGD
jgi:hypothetical protein